MFASQGDGYGHQTRGEGGPATLRREQARKFASTSEFMRHLIRVWNTEQLMQTVERSRVEIAAGKGKVLRSLKDLR